MHTNQYTRSIKSTSSTTLYLYPYCIQFVVKLWTKQLFDFSDKRNVIMSTIEHDAHILWFDWTVFCAPARVWSRHTNRLWKAFVFFGKFSSFSINYADLSLILHFLRCNKTRGVIANEGGCYCTRGGLLRKLNG